MALGSVENLQDNGVGVLKNPQKRNQFFEHPGIEVPGPRRCMPVVSFQNQATHRQITANAGKDAFLD